MEKYYDTHKQFKFTEARVNPEKFYKLTEVYHKQLLIIRKSIPSRVWFHMTKDIEIKMIDGVKHIQWKEILRYMSDNYTEYIGYALKKQWRIHDLTQIKLWNY